MMLQIRLIEIGPLGLEIFMVESVDTRMHIPMHGRRLNYILQGHLVSPRLKWEGSRELKWHSGYVDAVSSRWSKSQFMMDN